MEAQINAQVNAGMAWGLLLLALICAFVGMSPGRTDQMSLGYALICLVMSLLSWWFLVREEVLMHLPTWVIFPSQWMYPVLVTLVSGGYTWLALQ